MYAFEKFWTLEHILVCTFNKTPYVFQKFGISFLLFLFTLKLLLFFLFSFFLFLNKFCNFDEFSFHFDLAGIPPQQGIL